MFALSRTIKALIIRHSTILASFSEAILDLLFGAGQFCMLHSFVSTGEPKRTQRRPPNIGMGCVHVRDLDDMPPPHVTEHSVHLLQDE